MTVALSLGEPGTPFWGLSVISHTIKGALTGDFAGQFCDCEFPFKENVHVCSVIHILLHIHSPLQIAIDTFFWNPIMHVFVWGSMLSWLVVIPITSSDFLYDLYADLFRYNGVAYEVLGSATFWFYVPLATIIALAPTVMFRVIKLDLYPRLVDDVRLKMKTDGRRLFKRKTFKRKSVKRTSVKRSGYAFAHEHGFAKLITSGLGFGMRQDTVEEERQRRLSAWMATPTTSRATTPSPKRVLSGHLPRDEKEPLGPGIESSGSERDMSTLVTHHDVNVDVHESPTIPGTVRIPEPGHGPNVPLEDRSVQLEDQDLWEVIVCGSMYSV